MDDLEDINDVLERWHRRFQRAIAFWHQDSEPHSSVEDRFFDLVATLVTGSYVEALLYLGLQSAGLRVEPGQVKSVAMGRLVRLAKRRGVIGAELKRSLGAFNRIRNRFAHDPDCEFVESDVFKLYDSLPQENKNALQAAFRVMLPSPPLETVARLTFEQTVLLTLRSVAVADEHFRETPPEQWELSSLQPRRRITLGRSIRSVRRSRG